MSARIRFEDLTGKPQGYVDLKGKELVPSNAEMAYTIKDWMENSNPTVATPEGFMAHYGDSRNSGSFDYFRLVDSDTDTADYPKD